jgi:hypothetical protein
MKPNQRGFKETLASQLAMNTETWKRLVAHGITPDTEIQLDFTYNSPTREQAEALQNFLNRETDYAVEVSSSGSLFRKKWWVHGTTQKTTVSLDILNQWVEWMVAAGQDHGCMFDGWGTSV